jgi:Fe(3+) dicitrate transport protein
VLRNSARQIAALAALVAVLSGTRSLYAQDAPAAPPKAELTPPTPPGEPPAPAPAEAAPVAEPEPTPPVVSEAPAQAEAAAEPPPVEPVSAEPAAPTATPENQAPIEVTVVGTRLARTAGSAHVLRNKDLERYEYDDPTAVLTQVPGVYSRTEDGVGLRPNIGLRGVNPDRSKKITLMEDGILFGPAPYSAPAAYYFPMITRMSQVRVIKGPGAVAYGPQTVGGAIDLITRSIPTRASGALDLAAGQYGYGKADGYFGASTDQFGFLVEGVRLQSNGFKNLPNGADTGFTRNEWMAKFNYVVDPSADIRNEFRLKLTYSDEVSNETYLGLTDADFRKSPYMRYGASALDRMNNHRFSAVLTHEVDFNPHLSVTTTAYRHDFSRLWRRADGFASGPCTDPAVTPCGSKVGTFDVLENPGANLYEPYVQALQGNPASTNMDPFQIVDNHRDFISEGVQSLLKWERTKGQLSHRLEAGLRVHYDRIERKHDGELFDLSQGALYPRHQISTLTFNKGATYAVAPHVIYALTWRALTVTPGMRTELLRMKYLDRMSGQGEKSFNYALLPGMGLFYGLSDELGILAGAYRGFSPAPPENAKNAKPESSVNYEAGARYTKGALRGEVIGFFNDYSNLTTYCNLSEGGCSAASDTTVSAGKAKIYGLETMAAHDVPAGSVKVPLSVSYTYTQAQFGRSFTSAEQSWGIVHKGDAIPYVPKHQLRAQAGVEGKPAGGSLALVYIAAMSEGRLQDIVHNRQIVVKTDTQYQLDASAWAKVWGPFQLYATATNLLNSAFIVARRPYGARPNAPRWVHVGLKAAF